MWILGVLALALVAILSWFFLAGRGSRGGRPFLESVDDEMEGETRPPLRKYSSTKISAADVNARLGGAVTETEVETDREYALVVDEEALKMSPLAEEIDEHTGKQYADDRAIRQLVGQKKYGQAYEEYLKRIEEEGAIEFHGDLERTLSEYFIRKRELETAARILEHHVATHAAEDIDPQTYFNLGYIHVLTHTFNKSRRFLRLFVESGSKPEHVARAKVILRTLEKVG